MSTPFSLEGKTALVTGGASGIGEATCRAFHAAGASIIIADRDKASADRLAAELDRSQVLALDITNETEVRDAIGALPKLDVLVNNAGIGLVGNIEETALEDFKRLN